MRKPRMWGIAVAVGLGVLAGAIGSARADSVSIDVYTPSASFGLNIGAPPPLVAVPRSSVYYAPSVHSNYFLYGGHYYLFHEGVWFASPHHNGPWMRLAIHQVPRPILTVPVTYYKIPPGHWKKSGPPPWREHERREHEREHARPKSKHGHGPERWGHR